MTYTTEQLLFAAKVRELAVGLRTSARTRAWEELFSQLPPDQQPPHSHRQAWETNWLESNPVENFVPPALERIKEVARLIQGHQG